MSNLTQNLPSNYQTNTILNKKRMKMKKSKKKKKNKKKNKKKRFGKEKCLPSVDLSKCREKMFVASSKNEVPFFSSFIFLYSWINVFIGGTYSDELTKKVTHLIAADPQSTSAKLEQARQMGITIVGEDFLS
jgi:hypothetical protein